MKAIHFILMTMLMQLPVQMACAQEKEPIVRLAKLVIDSAYLESYKAFLKKGIETALQVEPGVLMIYALSEKEQPTHFTIVETYANAEAYRKHIQTPHFLTYKNGTLHMVKSLELIDMVPLIPELNIIQERNKKVKTK